MAEAPLHWGVFWLLALLLTAAVCVFVVLARRMTVHRRRVIFSEWADSAGFKAYFNEAARDHGPLPVPLDRLSPPASPIVQLTNGKLTLAQLLSLTTPASAHPERPSTWHILITPVGATWPMTALRPIAHAASLLDGFEMSSYPSLAPPERFIIFGADPIAARRIAQSQLRGLLPADLGLMLCENHLLLDFSARAFDPIELTRIIALAEQIASRLPALETTKV